MCHLGSKDIPTNGITLGKHPNWSLPLHRHLENGDKNTDHDGLRQGLNESAYAILQQSLAHMPISKSNWVIWGQGRYHV